MQQHNIFALIGIVYKDEYYLGGGMMTNQRTAAQKSNKYLFYPLSNFFFALIILHKSGEYLKSTSSR